MDGARLSAPCPFCPPGKTEVPGRLVVDLDPDSFFHGCFRCLNRCCPGGFPLHFGRLRRIDPRQVPGFDPDRQPYARGVTLPFRNLNAEVRDFQALMTKTQYDLLASMGIGRAVADEMRIGFNGRYLVLPYFLDDGNCYAARCVMPGSDAESFWTGDDKFQGPAFQIFNEEDIQRCENGALIVTDGEKNLLALRELGYPGIAVPSLAVLESLDAQRFAFIDHVLIVLNNSPEAQLAARALAMRIGFKVRILKWPVNLKREYHLIHLVKDAADRFAQTVDGMIRGSKAFSPFASPEREYIEFSGVLDANVGKDMLGVPTGFPTLDRALSGIRGINILGGQPKAGKSCFFMQLSTEAARAGKPVIYYDFENGRHKIYLRTLCRLSRLSEEHLRRTDLPSEDTARLERAREDLSRMLQLFRVVTDRRLSPDIMRRQIDFIKHETRRDMCLVVIDSLHKLPFKNLSERRTGIDEWLRHMEAIRDEQNVAFLVVSELSRSTEGGYNRRPDLGAFKESGDIEYSADNAIILQPNWDLLDPLSTRERRNTLWLVASRENSPGRVAEYVLDYPFWGFREVLAESGGNAGSPT